GRLMRTEEIELPRAVMIHDFGVTASRIVFLDLPVAFDVDLARVGRSVPFRWSPDLGARVGVMPRTGTGADIRWLPVDPCFVFHVLNCFDDGDRVVVDVVRYDRAFERGPDGPASSASPQLARWTIDVDLGRVDDRPIDDTPVEFPRIDDTVAGQPHRFGYFAAVSNGPDGPGFPALVQYDLERQRAVRFEPGAGCSVSEPVFVRASDGHAEDEGWVLSLVYDAARDASDLVILDGTSFAGPPVAVVQLPARVPFGFHGSWVPTGG
ncbi:MAG TPA: carotenoid oxygenase family protein, partial [Acidimicrobiales bacterium]|nr:carotenoid oxygenase family protein [Acidimicrobiales bacterium]